MYRLADNPITRFPLGRSLADDCGRWAIAHLKSRREKAFAQELAGKGIGYYLPLYEQRVRRADNGKIRKSVNPLFPGYVAFVEKGADKVFLQSTGHVVNVIQVKDQDTLIRELEGVQRILGENVTIEKHDALLPGENVKFVLGPFTGMRGKVVEWRKTAKVAIGVEMFGQSVSMEVDSTFLQKI